VIIGRTGDSTLLLNDSGRMLFLKVRGLVAVVFCVCDGDFMVLVMMMVVLIDTVGLSEWLLGTLLAHSYLWWCW
jgi:hypothetical protein